MQAYRSFTIRTDIGGSPTEADKRVAAYRDGGILPMWTTQGYIKNGQLHHAGIIATPALIAAFLEASATGLRKDLRNPEDGHLFWPAWWDTLVKYGHADSLKTIEPPQAEVARKVKGQQLNLFDEVSP